MATIVIMHFKGRQSILKHVPEKDVKQKVEDAKKQDRRPVKRIIVNGRTVYNARGPKKGS